MMKTINIKNQKPKTGAYPVLGLFFCHFLNRTDVRYFKNIIIFFIIELTFGK